jgi:microcompartment protein CcmL/EutN
VKLSAHEPVLNVKGAVGALSPTVTGEKDAVISGGGLTDEGVIDRSPDDIEASQSIAKLACPGRIEPTVCGECRGQYRTRLIRTKTQWKRQPGQHGICLEHGMPC